MKYQTLDRIRKKKCVYNLIMAGRDTGKSTAICKYLIEGFLNEGKQFIRLFRKLGNVYDSADSWFSEFTKGGKFDCGHLIEYKDGNYYLDKQFFGTTAIISLAKNYRSAQYSPRIFYAVYDEYIGLSADEYIDGEVSKFKAILTTVFRHRDREVWLLGNNYSNESKFNPFHTFFGIDIDRDGIKQGQIRVYASKRFKEPARIAFEYGQIAYQSEAEIPLAERIDNNEVATTGEFAKSWDVFDIRERYPDGGLSFVRDSMDCFYIGDTFGRYYYPILNEDMQSIDWVMTWDKLDQYGKNGNLKEYEALLRYEDSLREEFGSEAYQEALDKALPYEVGIPLYNNENRYGENCQDFIDGIRRLYKGFTHQYCDGNVKNIVEKIVLKGKIPEL